MTLTREVYESAFAEESRHGYPAVDALERDTGFALDTHRLLAAAKVLACPVKKNPPNWQHGRVLYAVARKYLSDKTPHRHTFLDIGTAKGFSALCAQWAINDHADGYMVEMPGGVTSVDVMHPDARVRRNTSAEVDGLKTLAETLAPFTEAQSIAFLQSTGIDWLKAHSERIHFAFVDGKHDGSVVYQEGVLLSERQQPGDVVIFDDVQIPTVAEAVKTLNAYDIEYLEVLPHRKYAIARRK